MTDTAPPLLNKGTRPFSRFEWMIAGRYLRARRKEAFISVISSLTMVGVAIGVATLIVVVVPEKLQTIQEYRFLLYSGLVIAVLLFRPEGLLPRPVRSYFPGWRP